jgi:hypothetical protein
MFSVGQHDTADGALIERSDRYPDRGVGILACFSGTME